MESIQGDVSDEKMSTNILYFLDEYCSQQGCRVAEAGRASAQTRKDGSFLEVSF